MEKSSIQVENDGKYPYRWKMMEKSPIQVENDGKIPIQVENDGKITHTDEK